MNDPTFSAVSRRELSNPARDRIQRLVAQAPPASPQLVAKLQTILNGAAPDEAVPTAPARIA